MREKDEGTLEQLLMTPASSLEVLLAKILPLFALFTHGDEPLAAPRTLVVRDCRCGGICCSLP